MGLHGIISEIANGQRFALKRHERKTLGGWNEKWQEKYKAQEIDNLARAM